MPAPEGNQNAVGNKGGGRPTLYKEEYAKIAAKACMAGFTDIELADLFEVSVSTINSWKLAHVEFCEALKTAKSTADDRVERSLYAKATGYTYDAVKIFQYEGNPVEVPYREHVPPDTTAAIFWLKNRKPKEWRDRQEISGPDGAPAFPVNIYLPNNARDTE